MYFIVDLLVHVLRASRVSPWSRAFARVAFTLTTNEGLRNRHALRTGCEPSEFGSATPHDDLGLAEPALRDHPICRRHGRAVNQERVTESLPKHGIIRQPPALCCR